MHFYGMYDDRICCKIVVIGKSYHNELCFQCTDYIDIDALSPRQQNTYILPAQFEFIRIRSDSRVLFALAQGATRVEDHQGFPPPFP